MARMEKHQGNPFPVCECCGHTRAQDNSHVISQKRCKDLHRTELIWDPKNFVSSCRECHHEFENYKSGEFHKHRNFVDAMSLMIDYDPESAIKRLLVIKEKYPDSDIEWLVKQANERKLKIALG